MPDYIVTDPNTGKTLKLTGDSPPTEQELEQIFSSSQVVTQQLAQQPKQETLGDAIKAIPARSIGFTENLAALGTSALLEPVAGIAGLGAEALQALGADVPEGADVVRSVQGAAYQPRTEEGIRQQQALARGIGAAGEFVEEKITKPLGIDDLGGKTLEATGSPALATIVDIMPELAAELAPIGIAGRQAIKNSRRTRALLSERIKKGDIDVSNIAKTLDQDGNLIKNPNVKKAIKLMGDEDAAYSTAINFEKMNNATRSQVNKMLDVIESNKRSGDPSKIIENRPANVIGESLAKRAKALDNIKKRASSDLGKIINGDVGKKQIDSRDARSNFINALRESDIGIGLDDDGMLVADTSISLANTGEVLTDKKLNNVLARLQSGTMTAKDAHKLKRNVRELVSFDPTAPGATRVSAEIENAVKNLASDLNSSIGDVSKEYARANLKISESLESLQQVDKLLGRNLMIGDELADSKLGALSKRIGTNLASREDVLSMVDNLDAALNKRGVRPKDDIRRQVAALADLEKIFKVESAQSPFGFKARVEQGVTDAAVDGGASVARQVAGAALDKFRDMNKLDFDQRMKALRALSKVK